MKKQFITITTDASFCPDTKSGGFAFWVTTTNGRFKHSGQLKGEILSPGEAEYKTVLNALHYVNNNLFGEYHAIVINTDCTYVIDKISKSRKEKNNNQYNTISKQVISKFNLNKIKVKHVKAHSDKKDARSFVNRWCDCEAKKHMRQLRTERNKQKLLYNE